MLFAKRKQLKNLSVLLTGDRKTLVLDALLLNKTYIDIILWGGGITFNSWLKVFWRGKWNCFHFSKSFAIRWQRSCRDAFYRMKLDRMMKRKMPVGIHSSKRTRSSMRLFARRRSRHENDSSCSWCSRKWSLVSHDSSFCPFFLAPFSPLSWSLVKQAYLDLKEFWLSYGTKNTHNILATYLFARALVPSKSKFLPLFHALTVCDTTSFSAGREIAKIVNMDFCQFVSY